MVRMRLVCGCAALFAALSTPVLATADEAFPALVQRSEAEKPHFAQRQKLLLALRYDLADRHSSGALMSRGKPVQDGVRVRLPAHATWAKLAALTPEEIKLQGLWPAGFLPLPHPHH